MKILGICGSPNEGNTHYMIKTVLAATGQGCELIMLSKKNINHCLDCKKCHKTYRCVQTDDMQEIYTKLIEADCIVLGSPTYFDNVSGMMKNFMDRCLPFCSYLFSQELKGKKAVLLTVGNFKEYLEFDENGKSKWKKDEKRSVTNCLKTMENFSRVVGFNVVGKVYATQSNPKAKEKELIRLGKKLLK